MSNPRYPASATILSVLAISSAASARWQPHTVRQLNGMAGQVRLPARFQIVTESRNRVVACPWIVNMPEKDRLMMLVGCDYPHRAFVLTSDDGGATWTDPRPARVDNDGKPSIGMGTAMAYLGDGQTGLLRGRHPGVGEPSRWFSVAYG